MILKAEIPVSYSQDVTVLDESLLLHTAVVESNRSIVNKGYHRHL